MEELTRDSDLYDNALRARVINEATNESELGPINRANISYVFDWKGKDGILDKSGTESVRTAEDLNELLEMSKEERGTKLIRDSWKASGTPLAEINIWSPLTLPDGEQVEIWTEHKLDSANEIGRLATFVNACENGQSVTTEIDDENELTVTVENTQIPATVFHDENNEVWRADNLSRDHAPYPDPEESELDHFTDRLEDNRRTIENVFTYAGSEELWVNGKIGTPKHDSGTVFIPVLLNQETVCYLQFENPETNDDLWEFASHLGVNDPLLTEGEDVFVALSSAVDSTDVDARRSIWSISYTPVESHSSFFNRVLNLF